MKVQPKIMIKKKIKIKRLPRGDALVLNLNLFLNLNPALPQPT
jgi:hypothetical protein